MLQRFYGKMRFTMFLFGFIWFIAVIKSSTSVQISSRSRSQQKQLKTQNDKFEPDEDQDIIGESWEKSRRRRSSPLASAEKRLDKPVYKQFEYEKYASKGYVNEDGEDDVSIEEIDDERIDEIVAENDKNLLIFFYDRDSRCSKCKESLQKLEEIDDDLELTGYIEVVKSRDKKSAQELGVEKFPGLVYFRRQNPIIYSNFEDASPQDIVKWIRSHDEVFTEELDDGDFEDETNSYSPSKSSLDWFVLFYDSKKPDCNAYLAMWEAVAYKLRGLVHVGRVDIHESDDVAHRFSIDDEDECPSFILFRRGKMYKFSDVTRDVENYVAFAMHKYKEQRGRRVPEPPTMIQEVYESVKEYFAQKLGEYARIAGTLFSILSLLTAALGAVWYMRYLKRQSSGMAGEAEAAEKSKDT